MYFTFNFFFKSENLHCNSGLELILYDSGWLQVCGSPAASASLVPG